MDENNKTTQSNNINDDDDTTMNANIHHIKELERQLKQKQNEIDTIEKKWIHKMKVMEESLKADYESKLQTFQFDDIDKSGTTITEEQCDCSIHNSSTVDLNQNQDAKELVAKLTPDQISRYSRQLLLNDGFGVEGQQKLLSSSVLGA